MVFLGDHGKWKDSFLGLQGLREAEARIASENFIFFLTPFVLWAPARSSSRYMAMKYKELRDLQNACRLLELPPRNLTEEAIRIAERGQLKKWHPDKAFNSGRPHLEKEYQARFGRVRGAAELLRSAVREYADTTPHPDLRERVFRNLIRRYLRLDPVGPVPEMKAQPTGPLYFPVRPVSDAWEAAKAA